MADVRGASGVPAVSAFGGTQAVTPSTPIYVDMDTGRLYVLVNNVVVQASAPITEGAALTATGTNQATALTLASSMNEFTAVAAGTGAILRSTPGVGDSQLVYNGGSNPLTVYPHSGGNINNLAANAPAFIAPHTTCTFARITSARWAATLSY